jgi:hypothetical protein
MPTKAELEKEIKELRECNAVLSERLSRSRASEFGEAAMNDLKTTVDTKVKAANQSAGMNGEWLLKDLAVVAPLIGSGFAFAYVVGYFSAFDISWFPFFSLSEHVVFALRALPVAIGMSVPLMIALRFAELRSHWKWLHGKDTWFAHVWISILAVASVYAFLSNHIGMLAGFALMGVATFIRSRVSFSSLANLLYWATTMMVLSLVIGFISGSSWKFHLPMTPSMRVDLGKDIDLHLSNGSFVRSVVGRVIFVGTIGVLFYDEDDRDLILLPLKSISSIVDCPATNPCQRDARRTVNTPPP